MRVLYYDNGSMCVSDVATLSVVELRDKSCDLTTSLGSYYIEVCNQGCGSEPLYVKVVGGRAAAEGVILFAYSNGVVDLCKYGPAVRENEIDDNKMFGVVQRRSDGAGESWYGTDGYGKSK